jgi:hypothetical protein
LAIGTAPFASRIGITCQYSEHDIANGLLFPAGARDFSFLHSLQIGSWAHPASYPMDTGPGDISPRVKLPPHKAYYSPLCTVEVQNGGVISPLTPYASWRGTEFSTGRALNVLLYFVSEIERNFNPLFGSGLNYCRKKTVKVGCSRPSAL